MNTVRRADRNEDRIVNFQFYFEMIGVVAFAISGAALGARKGMDLFGVAMMGMTTAVGGGVLRDVCCTERPYIFTKHIYALASLAGAAVCMLLWTSGQNIAMLTSCTLTVVLRICAAVFRWSLPKARP